MARIVGKYGIIDTKREDTMLEEYQAAADLAGFFYWSEGKYARLIALIPV
jgi:hypothetical protein